MKAFVLDPMTWAGLKAGYNRPLDRHDFPHGHIPDHVGLGVPGQRELRRFTNLSGVAGSTGSGVDTFSYGSTMTQALGSIAITADGRVFRYVKAGAVDLVAGNAIQSPAIVANHLALTPTAADIGSTTVLATLGATAAAANLYAEGLVGVDTTPDLGHAYRILGHAAVLSAGVITLKLAAEDGLQVAWTSSTRVGLVQNQYRGVLQFPVTTATGTLVGIAVSPITAAYFGWVQTRGLGWPLIAGTPALGAGIMSPGTTAGASVVVTTTNLVVAQYVGRMAQVGVDGKCNATMLTID